MTRLLSTAFACTTVVLRTVLLGAGLMLLSLLIGAVPAEAQSSDAFVTTWVTTNDHKSIVIPTAPDTDYDFTISWGYDTTEEIVGTNPNPEHTYAEPGTYTVAIEGTFPRLFLDASSSGEGDRVNAAQLESIEQWGTIQWQSMERAFAGARNLNGEVSDSPDLSVVTSTAFMFMGAMSFNQAAGDWNVSNVTYMRGMFLDAKSFNQDIGGASPA